MPLAPRHDQLDIFAVGPTLPDGFRYAPDVITPEAEDQLLADVRDLPFRDFVFHGHTGHRRVVSYGWAYDFETGDLRAAGEMPMFLRALRTTAATFVGTAPDRLEQVLVTEYAAGAGIGWHRDKAVFGDVVGISLLAPCTFRLRRPRAAPPEAPPDASRVAPPASPRGATWERVSLTVAPRSAYLLRGPARTAWEHSIPAVDTLRYSVTFRTVRGTR